MLAELTGDADPSGREFVFAEHSRDGILQETEFMTMVRDRDWKLVHFLDEPFGQLFDLTHDPGETQNLWGQAEYAAKQAELLGVMREWLVRSNCRTGDWQADWR